MSSNLTTENLIILAVPPLDLGQEDRETLADYKKAVLAYRSWASLRWWNNTYASDSVPQDESVASAAKRVGYSARVADYNIKNTPWLSLTSSLIKNKSIRVSSKDFHGALTDTILEGFISLPASGSDDLENFFKVLTEAVETRSQVSDNIQQYLVLQRYDYSPHARTVRSFIRTCLFEVTSEMVEVQRKKSSSTTINVSIVYNEYEAVVNMASWTQVSDMIEEQEKYRMEDYVKNDTIEISG
ncbi:uncharacterized protein EAE97_008696 [Botrytis byssoidea]|uniref:Uncharacterized protein n=1 Tax=Botrytis byssoidea TaxID=139641 RepID=A0A9P5LSH6_9HELO|nr:uncharacterized protein EAE97_008696 [Botrytis byssoidea]KAF7932929.1 hypothetical protein EAE97_008696 [Botrytis byssoidea]